LREHIDNYAKLSALYKIVRNAFTKHVALYKELAKKTEGLIQEQAEAYGLKEALPLVKIDERALEALKKTGSSNSAKVINLGKSLIHAVFTEGESQPYLLPISERAEAILERYDDRQISTQEALTYLEKLLAEYVQAKKEHQQSGFDLNTFTLYWVLKEAEAPAPEKVAPLLNVAFSRFPNYQDNTFELRQLKAELYKVLLPAVGKERMVDLAERVLKLKRK
jgi:type I restriction enzyme R subunit